MKPGDLVMTRNMGTGSGEFAFVLKSSKSRFAVSPIGVIPMKYTTMETCDILWRGVEQGGDLGLGQPHGARHGAQPDRRMAVLGAVEDEFAFC